MKLVVQNLPFREWLKAVSLPPIKVSQAKLDRMNEAAKAELEAANNRKIIDPCKINVFIDPAKEALSKR